MQRDARNCIYGKIAALWAHFAAWRCPLWHHCVSLSQHPDQRPWATAPMVAPPSVSKTLGHAVTAKALASTFLQPLSRWRDADAHWPAPVYGARQPPCCLRVLKPFHHDTSSGTWLETSRTRANRDYSSPAGPCVWRVPAAASPPGPETPAALPPGPARRPPPATAPPPAPRRRRRPRRSPAAEFQLPAAAPPRCPRCRCTGF